MTIDLRICERDWVALRKQFQSSFRGRAAAETGALAVLGERRSGEDREFIVTELLLPGDGDLKVASGGALVFAASFIRRAHLRMRREDLAGIATFHTHPGADDCVSFSGYDDQQDPLLIGNLKELEPRTHLVSVVAGKRSQCGRVFSNGRSIAPLRRLIVVGEHLRFMRLDGQAQPAAPSASAIFDSALALTGSGALGMLRGMKVAVIGASGTGSLFCELLLRAGCRRLLLIDPDIVEKRNLNRILYTRPKDADQGLPKVEVLRREIERLGFGCSVEPVQDTILDADVLRRVADCDLVVGCVDRSLPRHLLCELTAQYLLPYIDVGSEIGGDDDGIVSVDSRVSFISPGRHCLTCTGVVNARRLRFESLTATEREREISLGYSDDLLLQQPAVMDLNMRAAATGMLLLRHILQPFLREPVPVAISENMVTYRTVAPEVARSHDPACPTCQANRHFGYGDFGPRIGFDRETVRRIMGAEFKAGQVARRDRRWWRHPLIVVRNLGKAMRKLYGGADG